MDEFSSTQSGLLKEFYPDTDPVGKVLKKKREKLYETKVGVDEESSES